MIAASQRSIVMIAAPSRIVAKPDVQERKRQQSDDEADPKDVSHVDYSLMLARVRGLAEAISSCRPALDLAGKGR